MKKYIHTTVLVVLAILFVACENDPITISYGVPVKVNPSGVISPFTFEMKTGELESFNTNYRLRIRILAYDSNGKLAAADSAFVTNYASIMNSSMKLSEGDYTLIAITDVVRRPSDKTTFEYWNLTNIHDINQIKISDTGYVGGKNKILGVDSQHVTVTGDNNTVIMSPTPVGALLCIRYRSIHQFSDVIEYKLQTNRSSDFLTFDSDGNAISTPQNSNNQFRWRMAFFNPQDDDWKNTTNLYEWNFTFPVSNANYRFVYSTATETDEVLISNMIVNLNAGDEYIFLLNLNDEDSDGNITYYYGKVNGNSTRITRAEELPMTPWKESKIVDVQHSSMLKDLVQ